MTKQERTKQLKRRYFWFFWILLCIICWVPFFKTRVFGAEVEYPTAGATSILTEVLSKPVVETEEVEVVQATYEEESEIESVDVSSDLIYSARRFKRLGVVYYGGYKYTYYSDLVLPGGGLKIPGRHYDENGYICDEDGYICSASQMHSKGTVLDSPFGKKVKIYDWCDIKSIDIYVHWK